jgi:hypothetical protein
LHNSVLKGSAGQDRAGQGRAGQGRAGQGRAGFTMLKSRQKLGNLDLIFCFLVDKGNIKVNVESS